MNAKTIIPLLLLLIIPPLEGLEGAEEAVAVQNKPDLDDAGTLQKILDEAVLWDTLEERGPEGAKLLYAPDSQAPFTGWVKGIHGNGKVALLFHFRGGKQDGPAIVWYKIDQKKEQQTFKDGNPEGLFTQWHENGTKKQEGSYENGKMEGPFIQWHDNGKKMLEGTYKDGKLEGQAILRYENGAKSAVGSYKGSKQDGLGTQWYENGTKSSESTHKGGQLEGLVTQWHANGTKHAESHYKNGKKEGPCIHWYENGQKEAEHHFKDGKKEGLDTRWYENGKKQSESHYKDGKMEGLVTQSLENGEGSEQLHFKNGNQVFENEPDLNDAETLKKILGNAVKWETLKKNEQTGLYHALNEPKPYTGWIKKIHDNEKIEMLGSLKDGMPVGLWTWWDKNGEKEEEKRHPGKQNNDRLREIHCKSTSD